MKRRSVIKLILGGTATAAVAINAPRIYKWSKYSLDDNSNKNVSISSIIFPDIKGENSEVMLVDRYNMGGEISERNAYVMENVHVKGGYKDTPDDTVQMMPFTYNGLINEYMKDKPNTGTPMKRLVDYTEFYNNNKMFKVGDNVKIPVRPLNNDQMSFLESIIEQYPQNVTQVYAPAERYSKKK